METIFIYLLKSSALVAVFYFAYTFLVQKETFFNSNRWFLLSGLFTSILLPLFFIEKIVFIDKPIYSPTDFVFSPTNQMPINTVESFNWLNLFYIGYGILVIVLILKIILELVSLFKLIKNKEVNVVKPFALIDINENINPFSFFKYIVFNSKMYSNSELQNIISHEKVHSLEKHSIDVLIAKVFCAIFWFNPFVWLYKNAIIQNLEYIADQKAIQNTENKKAYQMTLLKVVSDQNCLSITNSFYQSLIKKRIVMLNKNQSKQRNIWKYAVILPALVAFIIFFQVKLIAQEKSGRPNYYNKNQSEIDPIVINKNTSDNKLKEIAETVKTESDVDIKFKNVKRNNKEEIIAISTYFKNQKGTKGNHIIVSDEPIKPFYINIQKDKKGRMSINLGNDNRIALNENEDNSNSDYAYQDNSDDQEMANLPTPPTPPTPPNGPDMSNMPAPPTPPNFPKHPNVKAPTDPNDEKGWQKFEADMDKFAKSWENGPDMKKFEAQMKIYEAQMEKWQPDMTNFEKEMEKFEVKMKVYEDKMEAYHETIGIQDVDTETAIQDSETAARDSQTAIRNRHDAMRDRMNARRDAMNAKKEKLEAEKRKIDSEK
ncbi:M56 family metallopeptidase [Flavobacterium sp.]|uniref:M56 family metallopeptidase n=1 Tax=Flavobacterium sp. TaxID=239 RepID=UPI00286B9E6F|nr:M56 family metallopeptidase [Flavobacterium sp.]